MLSSKGMSEIADELRQTFAAGRCADGEELLAGALEAGLAWDVLTRAVAEGVAHYYGMRRLPEEQLAGALALY